jgi:hypothetical protein
VLYFHQVWLQRLSEGLDQSSGYLLPYHSCHLLFLSWKVLISPSKLKDSFAEYKILGWQLLFQGVSYILLHAFLAVSFCVRGLRWFLCVLLGMEAGVFFPKAFITLSLHFSLGILVMMWCRVVLFWSCLFGVWNVFCTCVSILLCRLDWFSVLISLNMFSMLLICISAPSTPWILRFGLLIGFQISHIL